MQCKKLQSTAVQRHSIALRSSLVTANQADDCVTIFTCGVISDVDTIAFIASYLLECMLTVHSFHCICCNVCLQCINLFSKLETVFLGNSLDPATRPVARCSLRCCMTTQCRPPHPVWLTCPQPHLKMYFSQIAKCICLK